MADYGHEQTDALIDELEKKIAREYRQAVKEAQEKLDDYLRRFEVKDDKWRLMVARGEKTREEYAEWRKGQIIVGERWTALRDQLAEDYHNSNVIARSVVLGYMPEVYAININYATYLIERQARVDTAFTLYSRESVERILRENPALLQPPGEKMRQTFKAWDAYKRGKSAKLTKKQKAAFDKLLAAEKDVRWQAGKIQSITLQSIVQGESIPNMSRRIARELGEINHASTIRYARTAMTGAQNAGRQDAYKRAKETGVNMRRKWIATLDNRTRHEHRQLDGQIRGIDEPFEVDGQEIMFPGDPSAAPELTWNCRCTTRAVVDGWESKSGALRSNAAIEGQTYEEWREGHSKPQRITKQEEIAEAMRRKTIRELYAKK